MKPLNFFRSVCSWGHILFSIMRVLAVIGAVGTLIGIFSLALMPRNFFTLDIVTQMDMKFNLSSILGEEWENMLSEAEGEVFSELPEGAEFTKEGLEISEIIPSTTMENKALALSMIPSFVDLLLSFFLFLFLSRIFKALKTSPDPLLAPVSENFRHAGSLMMALGVAPALCGSLVSLLTQTENLLGETSFDLFLVFMGFVLWAASDLFLYAAASRTAPNFPFTPPTGPSSPTTENIPQNPPQNPPQSQNSDHNPHAF